MIESVNVVGRGRVGSRCRARLRERGVDAARRRAPTSSCSACPTARSRRSPRAIAPGPWVAHVSGATPLAALDPHERRFCLHPLQTFTLGRGPEQLDGAWAARHRRDRRGARARPRAGRDARPAPVRARRRRRAALPRGRRDRLELPRHAVPRRLARCSSDAGAPPEALVPLMRRTIENGFELTGPISRGDWATRRGAPRARSASARPELEPLYRVLAEATAP